MRFLKLIEWALKSMIFGNTLGTWMTWESQDDMVREFYGEESLE